MGRLRCIVVLACLLAQVLMITAALAVSNDFDGDGKTDLALQRICCDGNWFVSGSTSGFMIPALGFGSTEFPPTEGSPGFLFTPMVADIDSDGKADPVVFEPDTGNWYAIGSTDGLTTLAVDFGRRVSSSLFGKRSMPLLGDFDGDGLVDLGIYEVQFSPGGSVGDFLIIGTSAGSLEMWSNVGGLGFTPLAGDFDGDGIDDFALYKKDTGEWLINQSTGGLRIHPNFGGTGYIPVPGDYDGDGVVDLAVYQSATGHWFFDRSTDGAGVHPAFGGSGFTPVPADYDGDGKTDVGVYDTATGNWIVVGTTVGLFSPALNFGGAGYLPLVGDFDADGKADPVAYEGLSNASWIALGSSAGALLLEENFPGSPTPGDYDGDGVTDPAVEGNVHQSSDGDVQIEFQGPVLSLGTLVYVPGDYDGDGKTDLAAYSGGLGDWFFQQSSLGFTTQLGFGGPGYIPVPADYDGDGRTDTAVYEQATGNWFISQSTAGFRIDGSFGGSGFLPVPEDYDGDGKADPAVYESSTGNWFFLRSVAGFGQLLSLGGPGFMPVPGDYDGDGFADPTVFESSTGRWSLDRSSAGSVEIDFGGDGFVPVLPQVTILRAMGLL